ncbi:MAG: pteridine reductase [Xanthomonadales bacterium]|nr:pteridine reductase [Gammaproteobacteria bacterium]MBT8052845.1 pteridine reductase [Gammaproteobacteria bacterium]NND55694.1 pteridine reductase [Xanthomonadales bacterium]NNK50005.1 pteridine reductase [Xanthomonadales bacterium]
MSSRKTALVTGAAARIGAAIVETLHARGCDVVLHYNSSAEPAQRVVDRLNAKRANSASLAQADLSAPDDVARLADEISGRFGRLDVLVNNASRFYPTTAGETLAWQWEDLLNSNLRGPYFLVQALLEPLKTAGGSVVNIVDIHAERPMKRHAVYCISKAGLAMMTQALAQELGPSVRVNGVSPGAILWAENEQSRSLQQAILDRTALGRTGEPADIATAVVYLALDAPYVTGQILAVDGGRSVNM